MGMSMCPAAPPLCPSPTLICEPVQAGTAGAPPAAAVVVGAPLGVGPVAGAETGTAVDAGAEAELVAEFEADAVGEPGPVAVVLPAAVQPVRPRAAVIRTRAAVEVPFILMWAETWLWRTPVLTRCHSSVRAV